jgi:hypothetical protein
VPAQGADGIGQCQHQRQQGGHALVQGAGTAHGLRAVGFIAQLGNLCIHGQDIGGKQAETVMALRRAGTGGEHAGDPA